MTCELAEFLIDEKPVRVIMCCHEYNPEPFDRRKWNREKRQMSRGLLGYIILEENLGEKVGRKKRRRLAAQERGGND